MSDGTPPGRHWLLVRRSLLVLLVVLLIGPITYVYRSAFEAHRGAAILTVLPRFLEGLPPKDTLIGQALLQNFIEYRHNTVVWSATYFSCLFLSAAFSAFAGLVLKLEFFVKNTELKKDMAALLAVIAALLITLSSVGDFQNKWQANRLAASQMENLAYDFMVVDGGRTLEEIVLKIQDINRTRNQDIVGANKSGKVNTPTRSATKQGSLP